MNKTLWERIWETRTGYLMVVPNLAFLLIFQYYPAVSGLYRSLFDWNAGLEGTFVGLANFIELFTDDKVFIRSLRNMALLTLWYLISFVGLSTGVAVLIHRIRNDSSKYIFRLFMILPAIIPAVVLILLWKFIYDSTIGPLNAILIGVGLQDWTHAWLAEPKIALYAVMLRNFPWIDGISVLILLAGLQAIPVEIIESGLLDGASGWRRLRYIELPLITGQIKLLLVLTIMWGVQEYTAVWAMTQGGPIDATQVSGMWMYFNAFLTTTMPFFKTNIEALEAAGLRDKVRVMVGGAPITMEYAMSVGADGFGPDASQSVRLAKRLMVDMGYDVDLDGDGRSSAGESALLAAVDAVEGLMKKAEEEHVSG